MNTEVNREPALTPQEINQEIDDTFTFNSPISIAHAQSCEKIHLACKSLAQLVVTEVPEGRERSIALNNILSAALFARHGFTKRQVALIAATPAPENCPEPVPVESQPSESAPT